MPDTRMVRVSSKGQITLPRSLREKTGIVNGDYLYIEEVDGILLIEKPVPSRLSQLASGLRKNATAQNFTRNDLEKAINHLRH